MFRCDHEIKIKMNDMPQCQEWVYISIAIVRSSGNPGSLELMAHPGKILERIIIPLKNKAHIWIFQWALRKNSHNSPWTDESTVHSKSGALKLTEDAQSLPISVNGSSYWWCGCCWALSLVLLCSKFLAWLNAYQIMANSLLRRAVNICDEQE